MLSYVLRVFPYLRPYWRLGLSSVWLTVGATAFGLLSPWPLQILVDNVIGQAPLPSALGRAFGDAGAHRFLLLALAVVAGLLFAMAGAGIHVVNSYVNTKLEQRIIADFRGDLFRHTERLSVAYRDQVSTARLMYGINFEAAASSTNFMAVVNQPSLLDERRFSSAGEIVLGIQVSFESARRFRAHLLIETYYPQPGDYSCCALIMWPCPLLCMVRHGKKRPLPNW